MVLLPEKELAFIFQGAGMEYRSYLGLLGEEQQAILRKYCSIVKNETGIDLWDFIFDNTIASGVDPLYLDPIAIYAIDCTVYEIYTGLGFTPKIMLGYSLGLIAATTCGAVTDFLTGLRFIIQIYESLKKGIGQIDGSMGVIIGLTSGDVKEIIRKSGMESVVEIASENNEHCIVISGCRKNVNEIMVLAANEGALKAKDIEVRFPYHSSYAARGTGEFANYVEKTPIQDSLIPIISTYSQKIVQNSLDIKEELEKNLTHCMYWKKSIETIGEMGITSFVEVGLGDALTKFSKMINSGYKFYTYDKLLKGVVISGKR